MQSYLLFSSENWRWPSWLPGCTWRSCNAGRTIPEGASMAAAAAAAAGPALVLAAVLAWEPRLRPDRSQRRRSSPICERSSRT